MYYFDCEFEDESLLTNFEEKQLPLYERAVKEFGDNTLFISDVAYDNMGRVLNGYCSLKVTENHDRTNFWKYFDKLRSGMAV